ncbi:hypothetical protein EJ08DRAFT_272661 [Tothia fuscella]|uniref:Peptidase metallopeptidase domain-containing protein n=1 Tax=Tothia fuscella TaxID=1048955 RepID=A0A9P4NQI0_9PEZI|nr:hypothetical protein EJ08DRAFT_272661 [Tothia fuscella]
MHVLGPSLATRVFQFLSLFLCVRPTFAGSTENHSHQKHVLNAKRAQIQQLRDLPGNYSQLESLLTITHPNVHLPLFTNEEIDNFPWSSEALILQRRNGIRIYHNYTSFNGATRFMRSEYVPKPEHLLQRRGFTANFLEDPEQVLHNLIWGDPRATPSHLPIRAYTWKFTQVDPSYPVFIFLCYWDPATRLVLERYIQQAIKLWHDALGSFRGFEFSDCQGQCHQDAYSREHQDIVEIRWTPGNGGTASPGYIPRFPGSQGRLSLHFDPGIFYTKSFVQENYPDSAYDESLMGFSMLTGTPQERQNAIDHKKFLVSSVAHELGHVLGLYHEHQRWDSTAHIDFHCSEMDGYDDAMKQYIREGRVAQSQYDNHECPSWLSMTEPLVLGEVYNHMGWSGLTFLPFPLLGKYMFLCVRNQKHPCTYFAGCRHWMECLGPRGSR